MHVINLYFWLKKGLTISDIVFKLPYLNHQLFYSLFFMLLHISQMEYIRAQTKPEDGRILAIGHSMGGILLYAMLSRYSKLGSILIDDMVDANC